jgi:hypothetical protein
MSASDSIVVRRISKPTYNNERTTAIAENISAIAAQFLRLTLVI